MEHPTFRRRGEDLIINATPEAVAIRSKPGQAGGAPHVHVRSMKLEEVEADTRTLVVSEGGDPGTEMLVLSRCTVQFGMYRGQTFKWLLENDVGWVVGLVASHEKEKEHSVSRVPIMANKDALARYANAYPDVMEEIRFRKVFVDSRIWASKPGQEGQALVGFHRFRRETLQDESKDKDKIGYVNWLRKQTARNPGDTMEVKRRDQEAATSSPQPTALKTRPGPLGPAVAAFLGQRSVPPGNLRSTVNKILAQKTAVPSLSASRPALQPAETSDAELVVMAIEVESSLNVQVPPPRPPASRPADDPSHAPQDPPCAALDWATLNPSQAPVLVPVGQREEEQEEDVPRRSFLPPRPAQESAELLLPESWRETLNKEQQRWIGQTLFTRSSSGRSQFITDLRPWWYPPQPRPVYNQPPASADPFFACPLFLWMPVRMWAFKLTCTQPGCNTTLTKAGLYKTIRKVLDIKGWYLMATEYLECPRCKKKVAGWSLDVLDQLDPAHRCQFPAILTYSRSCDLAVVGMLRESALGNSATQLYTKLCEAHSEAWMRRSIQYLGECEHFLASGTIRPQFPPLPEMPAVPSPVWLLTVYSMDVLSRLDELKARVTSVFGSILKMDSTKKVTKKLAGYTSDTAWATNVGNEHGQVLNCVLTAGEGEGLLAMAAGLMKRYRLAGVPPPQLMYVDRDCCSSFGGSKTAAMFHEWDQLVVRLDIWHLLRRFAAGVTTERHQLYRAYMRQLSSCIFEWDAGDVGQLLEAKRSELGKQGMVGLTDAEVYSHLRRREMTLHCRRRTRGAAETELLLMDTLETFNSEKGHDTLGIPLLDPVRIQAIWQEQRRHLRCIQDPPGVQLYTDTGRSITKSGVKLPVYRCARGSTSLESYHLHLNRFIPGTSANGMHFQAFLLDGLARWNENRAAAAVEGQKQPLRCYSGSLQHSLNQLSQRVHGSVQVEDFTKPGVYTGELIGVEYLYAQTNKVLQAVSLDPDTPDEADSIEGPLEDEGFQEAEDEDPTVHVPDPPPPVASSATSAAARSGDPADAPRSGQSSQATPDHDPPEAPEHQDSPPSDSSSGSEGECQGPYGNPGYQHIRRLANALVEVKSLQGLSEQRVDRLVVLWQALPQPDKERLVYPSRHQDRIERGRFKASIMPGKGRLQRCFLGLNSGHASWPGTSRLVEAICSHLCRLHPSGTQSAGIKRSRWWLILADYVSIREAVLDSPRLMAQTNIQLFELNQRTISQWYSRRKKERERTVLEQGLALARAPSVATQPLPAARPLHYQPPPDLQPFSFTTLKDLSRQATQRARPAPVPTLPAHVLPAPQQQPPCSLPGSSQGPQQHLPNIPGSSQDRLPALNIARSTAFRWRKEAEAAAEGKGCPPKKRKREEYKCRKCGELKRKETGHSRLGSKTFCSASEGKTVEQWLAEMRDAKRRSAEGH